MQKCLNAIKNSPIRILYLLHLASGAIMPAVVSTAAPTTKATECLPDKDCKSHTIIPPAMWVIKLSKLLIFAVSHRVYRVKNIKNRKRK